MISLRTGLVSQAVRSPKTTKSRRLTDPEMFALSHVTASRQMKSHQKVIGTASRIIRCLECQMKTFLSTNQVNLIRFHTIGSLVRKVPTTRLKSGLVYQATSQQVTTMKTRHLTDRVTFVPFPVTDVHDSWTALKTNGDVCQAMRFPECQSKRIRLNAMAT
jgi:hypothetical protein